MSSTSAITQRRPNLLQLRREIQDVTESILRLVKARQDLAVRVAEIKRLKDIPIEDLETENKIFERVKDFSEEISLDENVASALARLLLEESKKIQRKEIYVSSVRTLLKKNGIRTVSIIGVGRMGQWFAKYFRPLIGDVILFDENSRLVTQKAKEMDCRKGDSIRQVVRDSNLIIVAVPIGNTSKVIGEVIQEFQRKPRGKNSLRIFEVSSVKEPAIRELASSTDGLEVVSLHPLFGGSANPYESHFMIEIVSDKSSFSSTVSGIFPQFKIVRMNAREHDILMGLLLSLPHLIALSFSLVLSKNRRKLVAGIRSPTFDLLLTASKKVLSESPKVYYEIQSKNASSSYMISDLIDSIGHLKRLISNEREFEKFFLSMREYVESLD